MTKLALGAGHRVDTYRGGTIQYPLFLCSFRQFTRGRHLISYSRGTCRACEADHFLPGHLKKVGT